MKAAIICAPGLEECEALITYDLLFRSQIDVKLVGLEKEITSSHNVTLKTDLTIDELDYENYDCLILPGGLPGTNNLEANENVQKLIDYFVSNYKYVAAICAAPSILAHKGLLIDNEFTCFPKAVKELKSNNKKAHTYNKIITGKGMGATFEFAYEIIKALKDEATAKEVLERIQY